MMLLKGIGNGSIALLSGIMINDLLFSISFQKDGLYFVNKTSSSLNKNLSGVGVGSLVAFQ